MIGLFVLATLAWILSLVYYKFAAEPKEKFQNTFTLKHVVFLLLGFVGMILFLKFITGLTVSQDLTASPTDKQNPTGPTLFQWVFIWFLAFLLTTALFGELSLQIKRWLRNYPVWQIAVKIFTGALIGFLIFQQIFSENHFLNNVFLFFVVIVIIELAVRLKRSAFALLFGAIMLLDIYLVWMAASVPREGGGSGISWYVSMFQSDFMKYFPFPIGFRWGDRLLGNGDVAFMCITVMYARRVWGIVPAVVAGLVATLPLLLLPFAVQLLGVSPPAWPYTIFIAPVALLIAIFAPHKNQLKNSEQPASA